MGGRVTSMFTTGRRQKRRGPFGAATQTLISCPSSGCTYATTVISISSFCTFLNHCNQIKPCFVNFTIKTTIEGATDCATLKVSPPKRAVAGKCQFIVKAPLLKSWDWSMQVWSRWRSRQPRLQIYAIPGNPLHEASGGIPRQGLTAGRASGESAAVWGAG